MKKLAFFLILLSFHVTLPAHAQEQQTYVPKGTNWENPTHGQTGTEQQTYVPIGTNWENTAAETSKRLKQRSLKGGNAISAGVVNISIIHPNYLESNQFGLLLTKANSFSGCHEYSPLEYDASYIENYYMDINVKHYRRNVKETQNPEFDCDTKSKVISGLIILNVDDLKRKNVRQIRFGNGQSRDTYNVSITENSVRLTPESMVAFKAQNLQGPDNTYIEYHFTDSKLLTLQVPMAQQGEDIIQSVRNLAYSKALEPVFERDGLDTSGQNNVFYFTDPEGKTLEQLGPEGYTEFGTISVNRRYDGPNGRVGMPTPLKVFLTRPNVTL